MNYPEALREAAMKHVTLFGEWQVAQKRVALTEDLKSALWGLFNERDIYTSDRFAIIEFLEARATMLAVRERDKS